MASKTYIKQSEQLNNNLNAWSTFISAITNIMEQYQSNIDMLQEQISDNESSIQGLRSYINAVENKVTALQDAIAEINERPIEVETPIYIQVDKRNVEVQNQYTTAVGSLQKQSISSPVQSSTVSGDGVSVMERIISNFTVFSNAPRVYVYASKTVPGLRVNGVDVVGGTTEHAFLTFTGSVFGDKLSISAIDVAKTDNVVLSFNTTGNPLDLMDTTVELDIKYNRFQYNNTIKPIATVDDIADKFKKAVNGLNVKTIDPTVSSRLAANGTTSLKTEDALNKLSQELLGGTTQAGTVVKKSNELTIGGTTTKKSNKLAKK